MRSPRLTSELERMQTRGQHERLPTDTARLAAELSAHQDTGKLIADFDNGTTPLRDVGGMITAQRSLILEAYQTGDLGAKAEAHPEVVSKPVQNLHQRVVSGEQDQPIGHNFFVNATGFLEARFPWAQQLDEALERRTGTSLHDIARSSDMHRKDQLLATITQNPDKELTVILATYLAGRSLAGEHYLEHHYGEILERAKNQAFDTTQRIGATTNLRNDMLERAAGQLQRATFGSFDHLRGLVTSGNTGAAGDYLIGSLRVEVQFDGNVQSPLLRHSSDAHQVITHELHHAGSAQSQENYRCGLQVMGEGLEANEGMTEYLNQISVGSPGIEQLPDGSMRVRQNVPYRAPVFTMLALHKQFNTGNSNHFAVLFNAYHGDVHNQAQLEQALDSFYQYNAAVSDYLR